MNPIDQIKFEEEYISGIRAPFEFHAGGLLFCVPYIDILIFYKSGKVTKKRKVVENFRPMDYEFDTINSYFIEGTFSLTDRNYLKISFEELIFVVLPLNENPNILVFGTHETYSLKQ